jgi:aromatic ring hydroxylase
MIGQFAILVENFEMSARHGSEYIEGLKDNRQVWLGAERVKDVTDHPQLSGSVSGMAGYFDWQHRFADDCLVSDTVSGAPMNASLIIPRNHEDLERRQRAFDRFARYSCGMLGRTPDYVNVTLAGFAARSDIFAMGPGGHHDRLMNFYREVVEKDLSMTHTIIQPAIDKSIGELAGLNGELAARVVRRTESGVVIRGAKILATLGPFADELFVYPAGPLPPGSSADYALMFSIPVNTKGVIQVCRDHYGTDRSIADNPFSSRFDEQDTYVIFDDVEVPYERLFIDCDLDVYNGLRNAGWAANVFQQTSTRAAVKLEFAYDLCVRMARLTNTEKRPDVAIRLGELWAYSQMTRAANQAGRSGARDWGAGAFFCDDRPLRALRDLMPNWMARMSELVKSIGGHNLLATPSLAAFDDDVMAPLLEKYMPAASGRDAAERATIFRMAWDFIGSALGGRVELYEQFYLASQATNFTRDHMQTMAEGGFGVLDEFLRENMPQSKPASDHKSD